MNRFTKGFTLIELLVVISIIGILGTIGIISYNGWSQTTAIAQINSDLSGAASAMQNARNFDDTGYPADINTLKTFEPSNNVTLTGGSNDGGATYCIDAVNSQFPSLYYNISSTNNRVATSGRCSSNLFNLVVIAGTGGTVSQSGTSPYGRGSTPTISATANTNYVFYSWTGTNCSGSISHVVPAMTADMTCTANFTPPAPIAPTVTPNTVGATTTFSWATPSVDCGSNSVRYQYDYTITPSGYDSGWVATASTSAAFTTSTKGQTYTLNVQAQCYNGLTSSSWSMSGVGIYSMACPTNFILVPGSATYSTSSFCVMKFEAKQVGASTTPISQASGTPWVNIDQPTAVADSSNVAGCVSCHLITEAEWMTIAQNVLGVASNWSSGVVGSGFIYSGNSDGAPNVALSADTNDSNGYYGTGDSSPSNQRRTLTLSNGQVIWDLSGNVYEWTSGTSQSPTVQPGVTGGGGNWREWTAVTNPGTLTVNPSPAGTGISGSSGWNTSNGVGIIASNSDDGTLHGFQRGGYYANGRGNYGVLSSYLLFAPTVSGGIIGFRSAW